MLRHTATSRGQCVRTTALIPKKAPSSICKQVPFLSCLITWNTVSIPSTTPTDNTECYCYATLTDTLKFLCIKKLYLFKMPSGPSKKHNSTGTDTYGHFPRIYFYPSSSRPHKETLSAPEWRATGLSKTCPPALMFKGYPSMNFLSFFLAFFFCQGTIHKNTNLWDLSINRQNALFS